MKGLERMDNQTLQNKIRGSLIGGAIGDALGFPVEFIYSYEKIQKRYGENGITRLDTAQWWTKSNVGKAVISDDTQMTLFTALEKIVEGREPMNDSKGCGGIMRIAPISLYGLSQNRIQNVAVLDELAADAAKLTHKHPLGYIPAYVMSHIIYRLATDESPTNEAFHEYVHEAMRMADDKYGFKSQSMQTLHTLVDLALELSSKDSPDHEAIKQIGEGWVAEETLAIAVYCCAKYFDDFEKAMIASVNHGGDSDSTGAVTGNILGAAIGYEAIPQHFKADLQLHDVILHVADDLWRGYTTRFI